jgi:hypothetical protein
VDEQLQLCLPAIIPLKICDAAMCAFKLTSFGMNLAVAVIFLVLAEDLLLYGLMAVTTWISVNRLVPETKRKSLKQIKVFWRQEMVHVHFDSTVSQTISGT